jgi:hypothetical protein
LCPHQTPRSDDFNKLAFVLLSKEVEPRTVKLGPVTKINETSTVYTPRSEVYKSIYFRSISFVVLFLQWFEHDVVFQHEVKRRHDSLRYDVIFLTLTLCK